MKVDGVPDLWASGAHDRQSVVDLARADFEFFADSVPHLVWIAAPGGSNEYFNRLGTGNTGLPAEATYGWDWVALIHPDDADVVRRCCVTTASSRAGRRGVPQARG